MLAVDRSRSSGRIEDDVETLAGGRFTCSPDAICRYAYLDEYRATLDYLASRLTEIGFTASEDPVGNFVARNRPLGERVFGIGSHCDSNRNGGKYDGTLGVVTALEVCRLNEELGLGLPLQLVSFLEEEGSGFGQMLLGSRIVTQQVTEADLRSFHALDDGRSFWEHAIAAGYAPERWRECGHILDDLSGWIELHIEQGRVLQDTGARIGVVDAIAGYVHGDLVVVGRADHAGATPMGFRIDAGLIAAETMLELERLVGQESSGTVGTVGEIEVEPGLINVVPGRVRLSLDIRGVDEDAFHPVARKITAFAKQTAENRGGTVCYSERQSLQVTQMDPRVVDALEKAARSTGEPAMTLPSGAAHDTMRVAARVPSAMLFVPCRDGISHSPLEHADTADAALGAEIILDAIASLTLGTTPGQAR